MPILAYALPQFERTRAFVGSRSSARAYARSAPSKSSKRTQALPRYAWFVASLGSASTAFSNHAFASSSRAVSFVPGTGAVPGTISI